MTALRPANLPRRTMTIRPLIKLRNTTSCTAIPAITQWRCKRLPTIAVTANKRRKQLSQTANASFACNRVATAGDTAPGDEGTTISYASVGFAASRRQCDGLMARGLLVSNARRAASGRIESSIIGELTLGQT
jgi:hypothetical protein